MFTGKKKYTYIGTGITKNLQCLVAVVFAFSVISRHNWIKV